MDEEHRRQASYVSLVLKAVEALLIMLGPVFDYLLRFLAHPYSRQEYSSEERICTL